MRDSWYDVAQICKNGHLINDSATWFPEHNKKHCEKCGEIALMRCPNCSADIQGRYHEDSEVGPSPEYVIPLFCSNCGKPYPWTGAKIQAARELTRELESISEDEKKILAQSIDEMVEDSPRTIIAAIRFKRILSKTSRPVLDAFRDIIVDIVSETAKKVLWPNA